MTSRRAAYPRRRRLKPASAAGAASRRGLATCGHRGRKTVSLYACRRTLQTGADLLTDNRKTRLATLFAIDAHAEVEATWTIYQRTVAAY